MTKCPWEDVYRVTHDEAPTITWDSFLECVTIKIQQVFRHDVGEALKYYITNTLRKPNQIPIHQFLVQVEQLTCNLKGTLIVFEEKPKIKCRFIFVNVFLSPPSYILKTAHTSIFLSLSISNSYIEWRSFKLFDTNFSHVTGRGAYLVHVTL
jgi:hypothetical protein